MKAFIRVAVLLLFAALLSACGGGGSSGSSSTTTTKSSVVIVGDEPEVGALVCLDINGNEACDADEPSATSDAEGKFTITFDARYSDRLLVVEQHSAVRSAAKVSARSHGVGGLFLTAPTSASVVSPFTTLVTIRARLTGQSFAEAEAEILPMLGLPAGTNLTTFNYATSDNKKIAAIATTVMNVIAANRNVLGAASSSTSTAALLATAVYDLMAPGADGQTPLQRITAAINAAPDGEEMDQVASVIAANTITADRIAARVEEVEDLLTNPSPISPARYTLTFDSAGGTAVADVVQYSDTAVAAPTAPTREGYAFAGWSPTLPATMPAENRTLTAQWTVNQYTLSFDSASGADVSAITQNFGTEVTAPAAPTRPGYTFAGWNPALPATMPAENRTLTAQWNANEYTLTFDSAGGSDVAAITQNTGSAVTAPATPTRDGYSFTAWNPAVPATMPAENLTLTAQWTPDIVDSDAPSTGASVGGGWYGSAQSVTLSCNDGAGTGCAATYYTTDGSAPTTASSVYSAPLAISADTSLRFFSVDTAGNQEAAQTIVYQIDTSAPTTSASVGGGWYNSAQSVTLGCNDGAGSGCAATYFTTDGSTPTTASSVYSTSIAISADTTLKFFSVDTAGNQEAVQTDSYQFETTAPTTSASVSGGWYTSAQSVTLSCDDGAGSGCAATYYTTDGTTPTTASSVYSASLSITTDTTLKFFSADAAGNQEAVQSVVYEFDTTPPTVTATPTSSGLVSGSTVELTCTDSESGCADIHYTLDDSTPDTSSTIYSDPISITVGTTIKFLAVDAVGNTSAVQTETYTLAASPVVALSAQGVNIVALRAGGTVSAWSDNTYGTMGHEPGTGGDDCAAITSCYNITPADIPGLTGVIAVAASPVHTIALKADGTVWAWGRSHYGALGYDGSTSGDPTFDGALMGPEAYNATPQQVAGISNVVAIAVGMDFNLALKDDGTVWSWGANASGQLGDGSNTTRYTPVQVNTLTNIVAIEAGFMSSFAIQNDGTLWAWGDNGTGQLGIGSYASQTSPVQVTALSDVAAVKAAPSFALALKSDGTVWSWGDDFAGQLGNGAGAASTSPVQVSGLSNIDEIAIGYISGYALQSDGTAWAWGDNSFAQLGDGGTTNQASPVAVTAVSGIVEIIGPDFAAGALREDGTLWLWGNNDFGQLTHTPGTNGDVQAGGWYGATAVQIDVAPALSIAAPTDLTATSGGGAGAVPLSWTASTDAASYNVYWSTSPEVNPLNGTKVAGATSGGNITGLTNGTRYYFVVTAVDSGGQESVPSAEVFGAP